jgi:hypothetical protein
LFSNTDMTIASPFPASWSRKFSLGISAEAAGSSGVDDDVVGEEVGEDDEAAGTLDPQLPGLSPGWASTVDVALLDLEPDRGALRRDLERRAALPVLDERDAVELLHARRATASRGRRPAPDLRAPPFLGTTR